MKVTITISMDNAAFTDGNNGDELARILRELARYVENDDLVSGEVRLVSDLHNNRVGELKVTR